MTETQAMHILVLFSFFPFFLYPSAFCFVFETEINVFSFSIWSRSLKLEFLLKHDSWVSQLDAGLSFSIFSPFSFFLSWVVEPQLYHWTKWMVST